MAFLFYDHLVNKHEILIIIDQLDADSEKKSKLKTLVEEILHNHVVGHILERLNPTHHGRFIEMLTETPYDLKIIEYLRSHIGEDIDDTIKDHSQTVIQKILEDFKLKLKR
jgi:hypothetical protein